jgi:DNA mismatch repair protein MutL
MTIEILSAQLANQIAAGEVVERPASVIKELVENSLDAGATKIEIEIEKGGAKRLKIIDNGHGIAKEQLTLALSRHATSKIKDLHDLEAISSLGFRGEALASISSVARLTLTSKPENQDSAWQACAEGRDMQVEIKPAAHPVGTSIDVKDLFFNTPARRKFMRTEKTEFSHIEEVVRRIALANLEVTFILSHNNKVVRQYRAARDKSQYAKRVAQVCGQRFIDNAIEVNCQHDGLHLWGWLAAPSFHRNQNDISYSYVNGRMMRDKLINHAIRQAYANMLPSETYPAFVLFLQLDYREVDVNVHPAKHEVRFHQGRYIHDFIFSVCHNALKEHESTEPQIFSDEHGEVISPNESITANRPSSQTSYQAPLRSGTPPAITPQVNDEVSDQYRVQQTQSVDERINNATNSGAHHTSVANNNRRDLSSALFPKNNPMSARAAQVYQALMTPHQDALVDDTLIENSCAEGSGVGHSVENSSTTNNLGFSVTSATSDAYYLSPTDAIQATFEFIEFVQPNFYLIRHNKVLRLITLTKIDLLVQQQAIEARWQAGIVSQPLLLPFKVKLDRKQLTYLSAHQESFKQLGVHFLLPENNSVSTQIREFPALLRDKDVHKSFINMLNKLIQNSELREKNGQKLSSGDWCRLLAAEMLSEHYNQDSARQLLMECQQKSTLNFEQIIQENSVALDFSSTINLLNEHKNVSH